MTPEIRRMVVGGIGTLIFSLLTTGVLSLVSMHTEQVRQGVVLEGLRRDVARLEASFKWTHGEPSEEQSKVEAQAVASVEDAK